MTLSESYEEQEYGRPYYDLSVRQMSTMASVELPPEPNPRLGPDPNFRTARMNGLACDREAVAAIVDEAWLRANFEAEVVLQIDDNGAGGDGLWLSLNLTLCDLDGRTLASVRMSPRQAAALASALMAAVKQRETDDD